MSKKADQTNQDHVPTNIFQAWLKASRVWPTSVKVSLLVLVTCAFISVTVFGLLPPNTKEHALTWLSKRLFRSEPPPVREIVVGAMDFPEQHTLGEIIAQTLEAKGVKVKRAFGQGSETLRQALDNGTIDCYVEYTGVPYTLVFNQKPIPDPNAVYEYVRKQYIEKNIEVSKPFNFENTWTMMIRKQDAQHSNIRTISQAAKYARNWRAGFIEDFNSGLNPALDRLKETYNLTFKSERTIALPEIYSALKRGEVDFVSGNSTDGELQSLDYDFEKLVDDRHCFPPYQPIVLIRRVALDRVPELKDLMIKLPERMNWIQMTTLNYDLWKNPKNLKEKVRDWRQANGF